MDRIAQTSIKTNEGTKSISILEGDIVSLDFKLDVLMISAGCKSYYPVPSTMIGALDRCGISVDQLADDPEIDLRDIGNIWLSKRISCAELPVERIGCVEFPKRNLSDSRLADVPHIISSFFKLIELAASMGIEINSLGLAIPGTGRLHIDEDLVIVPLLNACLSLLKNAACVKNIYIIERSHQKAEKAARFLAESYALSQKEDLPGNREEEKQTAPLAFLSYSTPDKNIADNLCAKLESKGIRVWYAPRNVDAPDYATAIFNAISRADLFVIILSHDSMKSQHVLNEVDLAFNQLNHRRIRFYPLKIDADEMGPAFMYYLSRQHWMDATFPPLEERLEEFVKKIQTEPE